MTTLQYLDKLNTRFKSGNSTEHTFRGDLQSFLEEFISGINVTNEPKRISCGAPDYIITRKNIPVGYIEAKDIDADLSDKNYKEQFERYKHSLENLCFTNYIEFSFYKFGKEVTSVTIAKIDGKKIIPLPENFSAFENLLKDFCSFTGQTIKSAAKLSEMMAGKARLLANVIESALTSDEKTEENSTLLEQMQAFKQILIHDIKPKEFSDIYSQTIAYGMFAARLHDASLDNFSRMEAAELIPKSNPFLRKLFGYIAGPDIDERIKWIVDALADIFRATNVKELLKDFGKATAQNDPIIHFYETFLAEYDPKLRKARGVWYTPEPVVNFIVRAVDDILKTEFNLPEGLADRSKIKIKVNEQDKKVEREFHKVQILDPATGTGTFLAEVIKQVYKKFEGQQGVWSNYVEEHLIPRLNGFELLMASYAMAHLKLDLLLSETGYKPKSQQRLRVYLTNSLEEHHPDTGTLFANWLSTEANEANHIKRDTPVMVVMGNPPYSGESSNKGKWIMDLMEDYKKEPGGKEKLKEKNPKWINDDYVKFVRYAQYFIEKNGEGVLAFINPHGYLDNPTFRGMRWNLLKTFDKIYTLDLHGNSNKKESSPDGSIDENVFDIQQGVSINLFIKTGLKKINELAQVFHYDLYGKRDLKYSFLNTHSIKKVIYKKLENVSPNYFFVEKDIDVQNIYDKGFMMTELFLINSVGIVTSNDAVLINSNKKELINNVIKNYEIEIDTNLIKKISYRPLDTKYIYYDIKLIERAREKVMKNLLSGHNIGLITARSNKSETCDHFFISKDIMETKCGERTTQSAIFPIYTYPYSNSDNSLFNQQERTPNLNPEIVNRIAEKLGLKFTNEKENKKNTFAPIDILDYIYAVLHSPSYREKYKEFLKIDFPRVPYPKNEKTFWELVKLGSELREIHLLESPLVRKFITKFPIDGNNEVVKVRYEPALPPPAKEGGGGGLVKNGKSSLSKNTVTTLEHRNEGKEKTSPPPYQGGVRGGLTKDMETNSVKKTKDIPNEDVGNEENEGKEPTVPPPFSKEGAGGGPANSTGKVWINETQYFDNVPQTAWEFFIGGYQPAQKWLKDRKERTLNFDDIEHYQKIIAALSETDRIMKEIESVGVE